MFKTFIKASERTGNPEIWAYEETKSGCNIVFGSLVTGGLNEQTKDPIYGASTESKKRRSGYRYVADFTLEDIRTVKEAIKLWRNQTNVKVVDSADALLVAAKQILSKTWSQTDAPPQKPAPAAPLKPVVLEHQSADTAYSW